LDKVRHQELGLGLLLVMTVLMATVIAPAATDNIIHNIFKYSIISGRMLTMDEVRMSDKIGGLNVTTN